MFIHHRVSPNAFEVTTTLHSLPIPHHLAVAVSGLHILRLSLCTFKRLSCNSWVQFFSSMSWYMKCRDVPPLKDCSYARLNFAAFSYSLRWRHEAKQTNVKILSKQLAKANRKHETKMVEFRPFKGCFGNVKRAQIQNDDSGSSKLLCFWMTIDSSW